MRNCTSANLHHTSTGKMERLNARRSGTLHCRDGSLFLHYGIGKALDFYWKARKMTQRIIRNQNVYISRYTKFRNDQLAASLLCSDRRWGKKEASGLSRAPHSPIFQPLYTCEDLACRTSVHRRAARDLCSVSRERGYVAAHTDQPLQI